MYLNLVMGPETDGLDDIVAEDEYCFDWGASFGGDIREVPEFVSLKRPVFGYTGWQLPVRIVSHRIRCYPADNQITDSESVVSFPNLETIVLDCCRRDSFETGRITDTGVQQLMSGEARYYHQRPKLHTIYYNMNGISSTLPRLSEDLDETEKEDRPTIIVSSMCYKVEEVLHIRALHFTMEELDRTENVGGPERERRHVMIQIAGGIDYEYRGITMRRVSEAAYIDFTEYKGMPVPLKVLERMHELEGKFEDDYWNRRGVSVSEKAWEVLELWAETVRVSELQTTSDLQLTLSFVVPTVNGGAEFGLSGNIGIFGRNREGIYSSYNIVFDRSIDGSYNFCTPICPLIAYSTLLKEGVRSYRIS